MEMLVDLLRIGSLLVWGLVLVLFLPPMARAFRKARRRDLDPIWAIVWWLALNRITFVGRNLYWQTPMSDAEAAIAVVSHVLAIVLACVILVLRRWYEEQGHA